MVAATCRHKCRTRGGVVLAVAAISLALLLCGCGGKDSGAGLGQSFNVIKGVSGDSYMLDGYSSFVENRSGAFAPNGVLVVGVKDGVVLGGTRFGLGAIIVVEGTSAAPTFRHATPDDKIVVTREVTVFGKNYKKGRFSVPSGGKLTLSED